MKKSRLRKRSLAKTSLKKALRKLETLQRLVVLKRDGGCQLRGVVDCNNGCSDIRQADHLITKRNGSIWTKYELKNLNELCSSHNCARQWDSLMVGALWEITKKKHGSDIWERLHEMKRRKEKFLLQDAEERIAECERYLNCGEAQYGENNA